MPKYLNNTGVGYLKSILPRPTDAQVSRYVNAWLNSHPEATTTVQDGSITKAKLNAELGAEIAEPYALAGRLNLQESENLFNINTLVRNKYYQVPTGNIVDTEANWALSTSYIPVNEGESVCASGRAIIVFYDGSLNVIYAMQLDDTLTTVAPTGTKYARFCISAVNFDEVVIQKGETASPFSEVGPFKMGSNFLVNASDVAGVNLYEMNAFDNRLNFVESKNLYNIYNLLLDSYYAIPSGEITEIVGHGWAASLTYVPVTEGEYLCSNGRPIIVFYDEHLNKVIATQMDASKKIQVPTGARFARFSISAIQDTVVIQRGEVADPISKIGTYKVYFNGLGVSDNVIVDASGNGDYTSFTRAVYENVDNDTPIIVKSGTYDIVAEYVELFGQSVVDNLSDATTGIKDFQHGVRINKKVTFESGSHLVCNWTGHTTDGTHRFCALAIEPNAELFGLDLDCTATFYCIHDDYGTSDDSPYLITYKNCRVIGHNLVNNNCIGGGCHKYSRHVIDNCYFDNNRDSGTLVQTAAIRYHNTFVSGAEPEVYVKDCYFGTNINFSYYGTQTTKMRVYVNNCYAPLGINKVAETQSSTVDNVELYKWNNVES